jgi:hypothetical protein
MEHGLYYVDRTGGDLIRLDTDEPIDLPGARLAVLRDALDRAEADVSRDTRTWGRLDNLGVANFLPADGLRPGVYYAREQPMRYDNPDKVVLLSGGLFPWYVQGDEKPMALSLLRFVKTKVAS